MPRHDITGVPGLTIDEDPRFASLDEPAMPLGLRVNKLQPGDPMHWAVRQRPTASRHAPGWPWSHAPAGTPLAGPDTAWRDRRANLGFPSNVPELFDTASGGGAMAGAPRGLLFERRLPSAGLLSEPSALPATGLLAEAGHEDWGWPAASRNAWPGPSRSAQLLDAPAGSTDSLYSGSAGADRQAPADQVAFAPPMPVPVPGMPPLPGMPGSTPSPGQVQGVLDALGSLGGLLNPLRPIESLGNILLNKDEVPLQGTGAGHTLNDATANALNKRFGKNRSKREWGRALEALKGQHLLSPDHHGKIMPNGDYTDADGNVIDNVGAYLP